MNRKIESLFKMTSFSIYKASFEVKNKILNLKDKKLHTNVKLNVNISKAKTVNNEEKGNANIDLSFSLRMGRLTFLNVKLSISGQFEAVNMKEETFEELIKYSGVANLLQIARSYIISMTSQNGLTPPAVLPMINLVELYKNENKVKGK